MVMRLLFFVMLMLNIAIIASEVPDYGQPENWIINESGSKKDCEVDLFYVIPTIFSDKTREYMTWHQSPALRKKAEMIASQNTSIFAGDTRVFAPYYRQAEFRRALKQITLPVEKQSCLSRGLADAKNAFRYYLKHYNKGRPFILFGFSQGAVVLLEVMKTELADPAVNGKLVAAYLIGYPGMPKSFPAYPHLRTAQRADDTGVIITYNSQAPGNVESVFTGKGSCYCINPVNWRTDSKPAEPAEHIGSRFFDIKTGKAADRKHFVSTRIDLETGALLVIPTVPGKYDNRALGKGVYHMNDLQFFHHDLAANGKRRIKAFFQ